MGMGPRCWERRMFGCLRAYCRIAGFGVRLMNNCIEYGAVLVDLLPDTCRNYTHA